VRGREMRRRRAGHGRKEGGVKRWEEGGRGRGMGGSRTDGKKEGRAVGERKEDGQGSEG